MRDRTPADLVLLTLTTRCVGAIRAALFYSLREIAPVHETPQGLQVGPVERDGSAHQAVLTFGRRNGFDFAESEATQ